MTPAAEQANPPATLSIAEELLQDGEIIILSIKPSRWFVLLVSWPVLLGVGLVATGVVLAERFGMCLADRKLIHWLCAGIALARLIGAAGQWTVLRYMLTDRRLLRVSAGGLGEATELPLSCVQSAQVTRTSPQRALAVGSLVFTGNSGRALPMTWAFVAQPDKVCQTVNEAIARAHR